MRLITSNSPLFVLSSLFLLSTSLPFEPRNVVWVEHLVRRATYSVVAVDGGAAATSKGTSPEAASTIVETIVQTQAPATKTIVETDYLPPVTDVVISTKTIESPDTTQTLLVTVTPSPATVTMSEYSIIDVSAPTVTIEVPQPVTTEISSSSSISSADITTAVPTSSASSIISSSNISSSASASTSASSTSCTSSKTSTSSLLSHTSTATLSSTSILCATSTSSALNTPYDDGQWHTTYPSRSNSTRTAAPSAAQTTSLPTLEHSSPVAIFADSVPGMT